MNNHALESAPFTPPDSVATPTIVTPLQTDPKNAEGRGSGTGEQASALSQGLNAAKASHLSLSAQATAHDFDAEKGFNASLATSTLSWSNLGYSIKGRDTPILTGLDGRVSSGDLLAIMGPSGAGKTTCLDVLCQRVPPSTGEIKFDGSTQFNSRKIFSFVEQDDALYGVLTVRETVLFAAQLSLPRDTPDISALVDATLKSLGLQDVAHNRIGTPIQRGISGGQKRRFTIACLMVSRPKVLVLDEPTSGLDSLSGREVIASVICTIHQPNFETYSLFDYLLLLANGEVMYNDRADNLNHYLADVLKMPTPVHCNPSDHAMEIVNTEFFKKENSNSTAAKHLAGIAAAWKEYALASGSTPRLSEEKEVNLDVNEVKKSILSQVLETLHKTGVLTRRNFKVYRRHILAFGIRALMYIAMGFLLATVWIHLTPDSDNIDNRLSVHFFAVAFLGFMSVAGIPAFLEERSVFVRERSNGLYGPGSYLIANTLTVVPFLFACTVSFVLICYWAIGLHPGAESFFKFLLYVFLGVLTAEFQSLLVAAIIPIFVAALAIACFANGLWMVVGGYFIRATALPKFWYYSFHWMSYQTYSFELLVRSDFTGLVLDCPVVDGACSCPFASSLVSSGQCALAGSDVVAHLGYDGISDGLYTAILIIICIVYRVATWGVLILKKK